METLTKESTSMNVVKANKENSSEQLVERETIENTPFTMIGLGGKWFGSMGEYRMTEEYDSKGECEDELKCITWNRIIQVMMVLDEIKSKDKELNNKIKTTKTNNKK
jgi:hypothetical protein